MKQLLAIFSILIALQTQAQEGIVVDTTICGNGNSPDYLSIIPGQVSVKLSLEVDEPRVLRCLLNGDIHHSETIETSCQRMINFDGVGLGSPDHSVAFVWEDEADTTPGVTVSNIFPWMHGPYLVISADATSTNTIFRWNVMAGGFNIPNLQGQCPDYKLFLVAKLKESEFGEVLQVDTIEMVESNSPTYYSFEWSHNGDSIEVCTETYMVRIDVGTDTPPDFLPRQVPSDVPYVEVCHVLSTISTDVEDGLSNNVTISQNPFRDYFTIEGASGEYTVHNLTGALIETGRLGSERTSLYGGMW